MFEPPIPKDEEERLASLNELQLLDGDNHALFQGAADLAAQIFGSSIALVSLVDSDRQWFAARHNLDIEETPRSISFCGHAINQRDVMVIPDSRLDSRFRDNPLVTGEDRVVFYAGAPLHTADNRALGTLCVIDHEPKFPTERQILALEQLARLVSDQLELRRMMLRTEKRATEEAMQHRNWSRLLHDVGQDIRAALQGIVAMSERVATKAGDASLQEPLASMRYSALSLIQLTEQLTSQGLKNLEKTQPTLSDVNPLAVAAAAISVYGAEADRRELEIGITSDTSGSMMLLTDHEMLRLMLFHALGFVIGVVTGGHVNLHVGRVASSNRVRFSIAANGGIEPDTSIAALKSVLFDKNVNQGGRAMSLGSVRDLCFRLGGKARIEEVSDGLELHIEMPVTFKGAKSN